MHRGGAYPPVWVALLWSALSLWPLAASAVECSTLEHSGNSYTICEVAADREQLRLFLSGPDGVPYGQFSAVRAAVAEQGEQLLFAANAGMYHDDRRPVGLYIEADEQAMRVVTNAGPGNFGLLPNGVFCVGDARADVIETLRFVDTAPACRYASQSGPMLVIDGELHPRFLPDSTSRYVRNGVGSSAGGRRVVFAISDGPVTFHDFGSLYRDALHLPQALYFDGNISRIYAPQIGRNDPGFRLGPIGGVTAPREP